MTGENLAKEAGAQGGQPMTGGVMADPEAEAWCVSNPVKAPKRDFARFLHSWFGREEERQA